MTLPADPGDGMAKLAPKVEDDGEDDGEDGVGDDGCP